ncbi:MAG TPA: xanthine dehydrogenase family protein molybdopterin-binding subunit [Micropepsaceae bacterium]|nr:xanthine dehydrogenase family protein molybdopterin-binding subunit [Micropepsaceae bacterium]
MSNLVTSPERVQKRDLEERMAGELIGKRVKRVEDEPLLRGRGRFVDDIRLPGLLHAAFLRSPHAHARLNRIEASKAHAYPGVRAVLTYADLRPHLTSDRIPQALPSGAIRFDVDPYVLAKTELTYVGEPIALVVATSRAIAEDAVRLIEIDAQPLPAVLDPVAGLAPGGPRARLDTPDNLVAQHAIKYGDVDKAFAQAAHRIAERFRLHKGGGHSIETRGVLARFDPLEGLSVWDGTQMPHRAKAILVAALGLDETQVRVIAPDVGGGFGPKAVFHPEELAIAAAAIALGVPVKWIEDRVENFVSTALERIQVWDMEAAFDDEGRLLAIRGTLKHDHGACTPYGVALPYNAATNLIGPYVVPACDLIIQMCLTNLTPAAPTRGAGRPQGTFVMERLLDSCARKLGFSRDDIRRRNLIPLEKMPYPTRVKQRDGSEMTYDSGDYPESQRRALAAAGWDEFPARQKAAREQGRYIGIGLCNYVEGTGRGPFESASVRLGPSGKIVVTTGATAQGQGVKTMLAQLVSEVLRAKPEAIQVIDGDTAASPLGLGAFASRQGVTAGNAAQIAAQRVAEKAIAAAAAMLKLEPADLVLEDGRVRAKGMQGQELSLAQIARALSGVPGLALPGNLAPGLSASCDFQPQGMAYNNGTHVCEVEVDIATGHVAIARYVVVHDCGRMINPLLVQGQVLGAVAHGIGATLFEFMRYDANGQPITASYADYLLPVADVIPRIEIHHMESPSPFNPLGVKGAAESGTIGAPAAIVSAIEDALSPFGVKLTDLPITPPQLLARIKH